MDVHRLFLLLEVGDLVVDIEVLLGLVVGII